MSIHCFFYPKTILPKVGYLIKIGLINNPLDHHKFPLSIIQFYPHYLACQGGDLGAA